MNTIKGKGNSILFLILFYPILGFLIDNNLALAVNSLPFVDSSKDFKQKLLILNQLFIKETTHNHSNIENQCEEQNSTIIEKSSSSNLKSLTHQFLKFFTFKKEILKDDEWSQNGRYSLSSYVEANKLLMSAIKLKERNPDVIKRKICNLSKAYKRIEECLSEINILKKYCSNSKMQNVIDEIIKIVKSKKDEIEKVIKKMEDEGHFSQEIKWFIEDKLGNKVKEMESNIQNLAQKEKGDLSRVQLVSSILSDYWFNWYHEKKLVELLNSFPNSKEKDELNMLKEDLSLKKDKLVHEKLIKELITISTNEISIPDLEELEKKVNSNISKILSNHHVNKEYLNNTHDLYSNLSAYSKLLDQLSSRLNTFYNNYTEQQMTKLKEIIGHHTLEFESAKIKLIKIIQNIPSELRSEINFSDFPELKAKEKSVDLLEVTFLKSSLMAKQNYLKKMFIETKDIIELLANMTGDKHLHLFDNLIHKARNNLIQLARFLPKLLSDKEMMENCLSLIGELAKFDKFIAEKRTYFTLDELGLKNFYITVYPDYVYAIEQLHSGLKKAYGKKSDPSNIERIHQLVQTSKKALLESRERYKNRQSLN